MARSRLERSSKMTTEERKAEDARFRQEYPLFAQYPELIYLDNAATTQKPSCVIQAESAFYEKYNNSGFFTELGKSVFYGCTDLESISIQNNKLRIGGSLFYNCSGLKKVIYGSVIVPEKTFYGCSSLTEVKLLDSVKFIGEEAFESCTSLVSIDLPYLVEEIGKRSFRGCTSLSNINFPLSLRKIGANAFQGCINLKKVELPKRLEQYRYDFEDTTKFKWIK